MSKNPEDQNSDFIEPSLAETMASLKKGLDKSRKLVLDDASGDLSVDKTPRPTREMETREAVSAPMTWRPADVLPDPPQRDGWGHRWVRGSTRGEVDKINMARAVREGWTPCAASDYPEIVEAMIGDSQNSGLIEFGGLILCRMPIEMLKARDKYFRDISLRQVRSIDERLQEFERSEGGKLKVIKESNTVTNRIAPG